MDEIAQMATDERTARIILALGCERGDDLAARFVAERGAIGMVHRIAGGASPDETARVRNWRKGVIQRLDLAEVSRVLLQTQELGLRTRIPSDPGWPALAENAAGQPLVLWMRGDPSVLAGHLPRVAVVGSRDAVSGSSRRARTASKPPLRWAQQLVAVPASRYCPVGSTARTPAATTACSTG